MNINIPYTTYGTPLQVFSPVRIETIATAGTLDTTNIAVIRVAVDTSYQINGAGDVATLVGGSTTGIQDNVTSITFPSGAVVEVM